MHHILIVDDDREIRESVTSNLLREGYRATALDHGNEILEHVHRDRPNLIMLSIFLQPVGGYEIARALKSDPNSRTIPIIMVSSSGEESDVIAGFDNGAADYITKPFSMRVLLARIRTVLRRAEPQNVVSTETPIRIKGMTIWPDNFKVLAEGELIALTRMEFQILVLLAHHNNKYFTRPQIIDAIKGEDCFVTERSVDVHISGLRKKLGQYGDLIETVHHLGYRIRQ